MEWEVLFYLDLSFWFWLSFDYVSTMFLFGLNKFQLSFDIV
jgi:hypothetical protein